MRITSLTVCLMTLLLVVGKSDQITAGGKRKSSCRSVRIIYRPCITRKVCNPCRTYQRPSCCAPCVPCTTYSCICPYYDMGGIWYGERFEWTNPADCCNIAYPGGVYHSGSAQYCDPNDNCGCAPISPTTSTENEAYLSAPVDPAITEPPNYDEDLHEIRSHQHLWIRNASSGDRIHVVCFHLQVKEEEHNTINFWVGWECRPHSGGMRPVNACKTGGSGEVLPEGIVRVKSGSGAGNGRDIIINLTEDSYDRVPVECP